MTVEAKDEDAAKRAVAPASGSSIGLGGALSIGVIGSALNAIGGLVRTRIVAQSLGPAGIGITSEIAQIVATLMTPTSLVGVPLVTAIAVGKSREETRAEAQAAWDTSITLTLLVTIGVALLGLGGASLVASPDWGSEGPLGLSLSAVAAGGTAIVGIALQSLAAVTALRAHALVSAAALVVSVVIVSTGTWLYGLTGFFVASAVASVLPIVALPWALRRVGVPFSPIARPRLERAFLAEAVRIGVPSLAVAFVGQGAMTYLREYLRVRLGVEANGFLQASLSFDALVVASTLQTLGNFVFPRYAATTTADALRTEVLAAGDFVMRIMPPAVMVGIGTRAWILRALFGPQFAAAESILGLYLVADIARGVSWTQGGALVYRKKMGAFVATNVLFWAAFLVNVRLLEPRFGLAGVGLAYCGGVIVHAVLNGLALWKVLDVPLPVTRYARWLAATAVAGAALAAGQRYPYADLVSVVVGLAWAWWEGLPRDAYAFVVRRLRRRGSRAA